MLVGLPALLEAEAPPVHLQDMNMVSESLKQLGRPEIMARVVHGVREVWVAPNRLLGHAYFRTQYLISPVRSPTHAFWSTNETA